MIAYFQKQPLGTFGLCAEKQIETKEDRNDSEKRIGRSLYQHIAVKKKADNNKIKNAYRSQISFHNDSPSYVSCVLWFGKKSYNAERVARRMNEKSRAKDGFIARKRFLKSW